MGLNCHNKTYLTVNRSFWLSCAFGLLLFPLKWFLAWMIAAGIHELCHIIALKLCKIRIHGIIVSAFGAQMITEPLNTNTECFCALAGPLGGCFLVCLYRYIPMIAFFALIQTIFNLLPINRRDGARVLRCLLEKWFGLGYARRILTFVEQAVKFTGIVFCVLLAIYFRFLLPLLPLLFILIRKTPCKQRQQIVQ